MSAIILKILQGWIKSCNTYEQLTTCEAFARKKLKGEHLRIACQDIRVRKGDLILMQIAIEV